MSRVLEICCSSLEDALAAERGGADRIELCEELWMGGVTPDDELIAEVLAAVSIPVFVLVRSRGGDFVFDVEELEEMVQSIGIARELGVAGIVCGALTGEGEVDLEATTKMLAAARPLPFTFHRAFDEVLDQKSACDALGGFGGDRILTAGNPGAADPESLRELVATTGDGPRVLACGGVRSGNVAALLGISGLCEFHSAARTAGGAVDEAEVAALKEALSVASG